MLRQQINRGGVEPLQQWDFKTSSSIHKAAGELKKKLLGLLVAVFTKTASICTRLQVRQEEVEWEASTKATGTKAGNLEYSSVNMGTESKNAFDYFCHFKMHLITESHTLLPFFHYYETCWCWGLEWGWMIGLKAHRCAPSILHVKLPWLKPHSTVLHRASR